MPLNLFPHDPLSALQPGALYIVATPIGNLKDITLRALETLSRADIIAAEDTRLTRKLLSHFQIQARLISCHEHNESQSARGILDLLGSGKSVALVSSAGTPLVSDPGYRIICAAIEAQFPVVPIPGVSAAVTALSAAGLPSDAFYFEGFLPAKQAGRRERLGFLASYACTLVFYESPHRVLETLADILEVMGDRPAVAARELTKTFEEFLRGPVSGILAELRSRPAVKGEFTLLVGGDTIDKILDFEDIASQVAKELKTGEQNIASLARKWSRATGLPRNKVYARLLALQSEMAAAPHHTKGDENNG